MKNAKNDKNGKPESEVLDAQVGADSALEIGEINDLGDLESYDATVSDAELSAVDSSADEMSGATPYGEIEALYVSLGNDEEKLKEMNKKLPTWSLEPPKGFMK